MHQKNSLDFKSLFCCIIPEHNEPMIYGYARVSTDGQSVDAQVKQLRAAGAEKVFKKPASGARSDRAGLRRALAALDKGDVLMVTRLDRLARSTRDLFNTVEDIAAKKAGFKSLGDTWADSTTAHGRRHGIRMEGFKIMWRRDVCSWPPETLGISTRRLGKTGRSGTPRHGLHRRASQGGGLGRRLRRGSYPRRAGGSPKLRRFPILHALRA
jgi:hypothetical protein